MTDDATRDRVVVRPRVLMAGPALSVRGGISSVANSLLDAWPDGEASVTYVATHVDGPKLIKAVVAVAGALSIAFAVLFSRRRIVHLHMSSHASFFRKAGISRLVRILGASLIIHIHGSQFDVFFDGASPGLSRRITDTLESADLVIALSEDWRKRLARMAPRARIRVLPNPVVVDDFARAAEDRTDAATDGGNLLFLGAFGRRKGVYDLLEAMPAVLAERRGVMLEMGGDQEVAEVERCVEEKGLRDNVRMLGWVRGQDKLAALARAHVYVLPSYHEGLPIGILEALAAGLPVLATPVGGVPEVVTDGVNGFIVEPGDVGAIARSILALLGDPELRRAMGDANLKLVRARHDAPQVARKLCVWYSEIASGLEPHEARVSGEDG